jgi:tetratricopeptide (TPR) repeat protein
VASICFIALHFCFLFLFPHIFTAPRIFGRTWGFHFITYFPVPVQAAFYALALALCVPPLARYCAHLISRPFSDKVKAYLSLRKEKLFVSIAILSIPVFWLLNAKYALLGDNFGIVERAVNNTFMPDEPGAIFILHCFYKVMNALFSMDGIGSIRLFSNLCGGVFIYLSLRIAQEMGTTFFEKVSIFLFYISFCTIQHFCGYIEDYASTVMMVPLYLYTSLLCLRGKVHFTVPAVCLAAAIIVHLECLMFSPVILYVLYEIKLKKQEFFREPRTWATALICGAALGFYPAYKFVAPHLMPLTSHTEMTLFSFTHLWEFLNGQLLGCGSGLFILAGCLAYAIARKVRLTPELWFLLVSCGSVITGLFLFHSALGSADWDIYSYSSLAVNVLALCLFFHLFGTKQHAPFVQYATVVFIGLMLLHSAPWISINASDRSVRRFEDIIKTDPAFGWNDKPDPKFYRPRICRIAMRMQQNGLDTESCNLYKKAYETNPEEELGLYNYFVVLCKQKQTVHASAIIDSLAHSHPASFLARLRSLLTNAQYGCGDGLTIKILDTFYGMFQDNAMIITSIYPQKYITDFFQLYLELLLNKKRLAQAQQVCQTILKLEPRNGINHYNLARVYFEKGDYDSVIAICTMLNKAFPGMPSPNILGARAFQRKQGTSPNLAGGPGKKDTVKVMTEKEIKGDTIVYYETLLRINPDNTDAHNNLGVALADKGRMEEAIPHFKEALRLKPGDEKVYFNLGNTLARLKRFDEAITRYKEALRINPQFANAHNNLGNTLAQAGRIDEAIGHFNEALNIKPDFEEAQMNLEHARRIKKIR